MRTLMPTFAVAVFLQFLLLEVRVALHLVHRWDYLSRLEEVVCLGDGEVGYTNGFSQSLLLNCLHCL